MENRKTFDELTIQDNYMFSKVMLNEDIAKHFLEIILGCKINKIIYPVVYERTIDIRYDAKSVRLDVILEDDEHTVYNLEMQATKLDYLVKRSRYYQDLIDLDLLEKGADYDNLNRTIIIFICTFDPFGEGLYVYNFQNMCKQIPTLELGDRTEKVYVNTRGYCGEIDDEFKQVLEYFNGRPASGAFVEDLAQEVGRIKASEKWRREFMTLEIFMNDARKQERKIGREEGREEGRAEGRAEGREEGRTEGEKEVLVYQVCRKLQKGKKISEIADEIEKPEAVIAQIVRIAERYAPNYDEKAICKELLEDARQEKSDKSYDD